MGSSCRGGVTPSGVRCQDAPHAALRHDRSLRWTAAPRAARPFRTTRTAGLHRPLDRRGHGRRWPHPLTLGAVWTPSMRLGTAILPAYTRGPALLAQSVAGLASAAPGRFVLGIGSSSNVIVERWNGIPFEKPFQQTRDMVRFLKAALGGEKVTETYDTLTSRASDSAWCPSSRYRFSWRRNARGCCVWPDEKATAQKSTG